MRRLLNLSSIALSLSILSPQISYGLDFAVVGALSVVNPSVSSTAATTQDISGKSSIGVGALAAIGILPFIDLEVGALFIPRKYQTSVTVLGTTTAIEYSEKRLQIPIVARFNALPILNFGAGVYYAQALGSLSGTQTSNGISTTLPSVSFDSISLSTADFGLLGSAGVKFPILPTLSLLADARYLLGLKDANTSATAEQKYREFELLVGINFGI